LHISEVSEIEEVSCSVIPDDWQYHDWVIAIRIAASSELDENSIYNSGLNIE
jgi:hypothetical protein